MKARFFLSREKAHENVQRAWSINLTCFAAKFNLRILKRGWVWVIKLLVRYFRLPVFYLKITYNENVLVCVLSENWHFCRQNTASLIILLLLNLR
jgi:hypothetical protein